LRCTYDPATKGGNAPDGRKVKGTIHWVPGGQAIAAEIKLYDRLFTAPNPDGVEGDWLTLLNPDSERIVKTAFIEPSLKQAEPEARYQFERLGYFVADRHDWDPTRPVFNRIVTLRDSWAKVKNTQTENQ
jgi:glutaminyl-tRNA synthetase